MSAQTRVVDILFGLQVAEIIDELQRPLDTSPSKSCALASIPETRDSSILVRSA